MVILVGTIGTTGFNILMLFLYKFLSNKHNKSIVNALTEIIDLNKTLTGSINASKSSSTLDGGEENNEPFQHESFDEKIANVNKIIDKYKNNKFIFKDKNILDLIDKQLMEIKNNKDNMFNNVIIT